MTVLYGWKESSDGNVSVSQDEWEHDYPILLELHERAKLNNPTWAYFGGVLRIDDRHYQVC